MKRIVLLTILVVLLVSCSKNESPTTTISSIEIHKGTDGLVMSFPKNSPPDEVYEEEEFPIYINLENKGATDIGDGLLTLGLQSDYMESATIEKRFSIEGKSLQNPVGEQKSEIFLVTAKKIIGESRIVPFSVSVCYSYETIATISVCIDPDVYNINPIQKVCEVDDITPKDGQGGPLVVTKIEPKMLTNEGDTVVIPQFAIEVQNKQKGTVIRTENSQDLCSANTISKDDLNVVGVAVELSEEQLTCNKDFLKLDENKDMLICKLDQGISKDQASYTTLLQITLDYGYSEITTKNVIINKKV